MQDKFWKDRRSFQGRRIKRVSRKSEEKQPSEQMSQILANPEINTVNVYAEVRGKYARPPPQMDKSFEFLTPAKNTLVSRPLTARSLRSSSSKAREEDRKSEVEMDRNSTSKFLTGHESDKLSLKSKGKASEKSMSQTYEKSIDRTSEKNQEIVSEHYYNNTSDRFSEKIPNSRRLISRRSGRSSERRRKELRLESDGRSVKSEACVRPASCRSQRSKLNFDKDEEILGAKVHFNDDQKSSQAESHKSATLSLANQDKAIDDINLEESDHELEDKRDEDSKSQTSWLTSSSHKQYILELEELLRQEKLRRIKAEESLKKSLNNNN